MHLPGSIAAIDSSRKQGAAPSESLVYSATDKESSLIPALPETLLRLELLCGQETLDLESAAIVVASDLGATIRVLQLAAQECELQLSRIYECVAAIGKLGLRLLVDSSPVGLTALQTRFLDHCRTVAEAARTVAPGFPGVAQDDAYLAGLFHELDAMPQIFSDWRLTKEMDQSREKVVEYLAVNWSLPIFARGLRPVSLKANHYADLVATVVAVAHEVVKLEQSVP